MCFAIALPAASTICYEFYCSPPVSIRDADNVIVIRNGEIVEQGTHQQLLEAKGVFHQLYLSQFKGLAIWSPPIILMVICCYDYDRKPGVL